MWLMIIFNITKDQVFTLTVEDACLEKPKGGGGGVNLTLPS